MIAPQQPPDPVPFVADENRCPDCGLHYSNGHREQHYFIINKPVNVP